MEVQKLSAQLDAGAQMVEDAPESDRLDVWSKMLQNRIK